jgi:hypothetical protein
MPTATTITTGPEVPGNRKITTALVTFDNSYVTGGEAVAALDFGLVRLDHLVVDAGAGYLAQWNGSTTAPKILLFRQTAATGALAEVPATTDMSAISVRVIAFGA